MDDMPASLKAGKCLRILIKQNYSTQEEFAYHYHAEPRTVRRWLHQGIGKIDEIQRIANHFHLSVPEFLDVAQ